jgi:hypothetical protein
MIQPLDLAVEQRAFHPLDLLLLRADALGEHGAVELLDRIGKVGENGQLAVGRDLREAAEHHHPLRLTVDEHRHDPGPQRRDGRRMAGEHAEIALRTRHVDLVDFAGEQQFLRRNEIKMKGRHFVLANSE